MKKYSADLTNFLHLFRNTFKSLLKSTGQSKLRKLAYADYISSEQAATRGLYAPGFSLREW